MKNKAFSRTKQAKQSQRESVSVWRTASQPNITLAILQETIQASAREHTLARKQYACTL